MMTQTLKHTNHLQMNIRLVFDFCFKYETLIRFDSGQRTHHDLVLFRLGVQWYQPLYLMNVFLPPQGSGPEAGTRGGTLISPA